MYANGVGAPQDLVEAYRWFAIAERCSENTATDWTTFKSANPDLVTNAKTLLNRHYSRERLAAPAARSQFLLPDLAPLG